MQLTDYLADNNVSLSEFARRVGAKNARTIQRYTLHGDMPSTRMIAKIRDATAGAVQPNDWFA